MKERGSEHYIDEEEIQLLTFVNGRTEFQLAISVSPPHLCPDEVKIGV